MLKVNVASFRRKTIYQKPVEITYFSMDEHRAQTFTRDALMKLSLPELPLDLNTGYPLDYITKGDDKSLTNLILAVEHARDANPLAKPLRHLQDPGTTVFITWRGIMTKLITTPYADENYRLLLCKHKSKIYIQDGTQDRQNAYPKQHLFEYYGHKAETVMTCDFDGNPENITNTNVEFCSVFASKLGNHHLILGAEIDCVDSVAEPLHDRYVEIKTHKVLKSDFDYKKFLKFKLLKTWAQSFLAGIQKVVFGFRDPRGILKEIKTYELAEFPRMARNEYLWDPNVCLTFGDKVLDLVLEKVTADDVNVVYVLEYLADTKTVSIAVADDLTEGFLKVL